MKIPDPPSLNATRLTRSEVAGLLRVSTDRLNEIRRRDVTFPRARLLGDGSPRWSRAAIEAWVDAQPEVGWARTGGRRGPSTADDEQEIAASSTS